MMLLRFYAKKRFYTKKSFFKKLFKAFEVKIKNGRRRWLSQITRKHTRFKNIKLDFPNEMWSFSPKIKVP